MTKPANPHGYWVSKIKNANKSTLLKGCKKVGVNYKYCIANIYNHNNLYNRLGGVGFHRIYNGRKKISTL